MHVYNNHKWFHVSSDNLLILTDVSFYKAFISEPSNDLRVREAEMKLEKMNYLIFQSSKVTEIILPIKTLTEHVQLLLLYVFLFVFIFFMWLMSCKPSVKSHTLTLTLTQRVDAAQFAIWLLCNFSYIPQLLTMDKPNMLCFLCQLDAEMHVNRRALPPPSGDWTVLHWKTHCRLCSGITTSCWISSVLTAMNY